MTKLESPDGHITRHAEVQVRTALKDTRIVTIIGPRQSGKTFLARKLANEGGRKYANLDDNESRKFAQEDPAGFLAQYDGGTIDEIQRAPGLISELKKTVDLDPRPGRFLLTGSVDLFKAMTLEPMEVRETLAGRIEHITLLPFSQSEVEGRPPSSFIRRAFAADFPVHEIKKSGPSLVERVIHGGYPAVFFRANAVRKDGWLRTYARAITERDMPMLISVIKKPRNPLTTVLRHAAVSASQLVNLSKISAQTGMDGKTVDSQLNLLEYMFMLTRIHGWYHSRLKRLVRQAKLHFLDSGLLAALQGVTRAHIENRRKAFGPLLETFVYSELVKAAALSEEPVEIYHYRDKDKMEVDFVLEQAGRIVAIEVKAGASTQPRDFRGLERIQEAAGEAFAFGILLYDGERIRPIARKLSAVPVSALWQD